MTQGLHRFYGHNDLHFLTFSCYRRRPLFRNPAHCDLFLKVLDRVRRRYRFVVLGYVVMPEHVHLLLSEPQRETLSTAIQALKLGVVRSMEGSVTTPRSRKIGEIWGTPAGTSSHPDRFWQARFYDFNVFTERKRIAEIGRGEGVVDEELGAVPVRHLRQRRDIGDAEQRVRAMAKRNWMANGGAPGILLDAIVL